MAKIRISLISTEPGFTGYKKIRTRRIVFILLHLYYNQLSFFVLCLRIIVGTCETNSIRITKTINESVWLDLS